MELKELSTSLIRQDAIRSFNLMSSGFHVGMLGSSSEATVLEMKHSPLATNSFPYRVESVKLTALKPASDIINKISLAEIYKNASILKRQYIALDPVYVSDLSDDPMKFHPVLISWAPKTLFEDSTLAILSSNGACEFRRRNIVSREWNIPVCCLNNSYHEIFPITNHESIETFEKFKELVESYCTTAFSWNIRPDDMCRMFVAANATGWLILFTISEDNKVKCCAKLKTSLGRISYVYFVQKFILACSTNGVMKIYTVRDHFIEETEIVWQKVDRIPCKKVHMSYSTNIRKWILITSKGSHVLAFTLSSEGKVESKKTIYLGNMEITGFDMLSECKYIFATITGSIKLISLEIVENILDINIEPIKHEFDHTNYQILGIAASPNRVAWAFLLYHNKPYTHPSSYAAKDAILSVCSLSSKDAFSVLENIGPSDDLLDCIEMTRLDILRNGISPRYENIHSEEAKVDQQFLKKLQLKLLVMNTGLTYQRLKYNHVQKGITNEIASLTRIIESVFIYFRLQYLRGLKVHSTFQNLSGKCLKYKLKLLQCELISKEDVFRNLQENLNTLSDCLFIDLGSLFESAEENCQYCNLPIDFTTLMCPSLHPVTRCSLSYVQLPLFTRNCCSSCNRLCLDAKEYLNSIFFDADEMKCPFCGFQFGIHMTETFGKI